MTTATETYFSLAAVGFEGWEHTQGLRDVKGTNTLFLRRVGNDLPYLVTVGRGACMLRAVAALIENQERFGRKAAS